MRIVRLVLFVLLLPSAAAAQVTASDLAQKSKPAKELFGKMKDSAPMVARAIGTYAKGCLAGAVALPVDGQTWQAMRLSRNRNWGHPELIAMLERLAGKASQIPGWHGILVGDLAQPRGGPMLSGHTSHQLGLDADVWLTPKPSRALTPDEREEFPPQLMVRKDRKDIDPAAWTPTHWRVIKAAAEDPIVERVLVNAAIKKALCREAPAGDRAWLQKVRPIYGHDYHMHIRIRCPKDSPECQPQEPVVPGDGCGKELDYWFQDSILYPKPAPPDAPKPKPKPPLTMADLPPGCRQVLLAK